MSTKPAKIWLDDIRDAPKGWGHLHNIEELEKLINLTIAHSFDNSEV